MGAIQRRRSLILVAIMMLAAVVPSISPYDIENPILEDEEPIMETGTGPEMAFNLNQAMSIGSSNIDRVHDMASGPNGSAYFIGEFQGTVSFGGYNLTSSGSYFDVFVAKIDNNGSWLWVAKISGTSTDRGYGIAVDSSGNAYVTGSCYSTCYFSGGGQTQGNITSQGSADLYVAMIKNSGHWYWMASAGSSGGSESGIDIAVDASGNSYVTGYVRNGTVFKDATGNGSITVYTENGKDIFAAKLDYSGDWLWVETAGGMGDDVGASIDFDSSGDAYITGYFTNDSAFGSNITLSQFSDEEMFVAKVGVGATGGTSWSWAVPFTGL
ncbi:MAG: hypothetical protein HN696_08380, partial [Euryarchaeota archaeon]|nr:hypothetical protein [Euryarchaeota archaeon]